MPENEGWYWPEYRYDRRPRTKRHYFVGLTSLCGRWHISPIHPDEYRHGIYTGPDNCRDCKRQLVKLERKEQGDV